MDERRIHVLAVPSLVTTSYRAIK